ncbi:hypothetical protein GGI43DRAFT_303842 [Trichoderma evansii]
MENCNSCFAFFRGYESRSYSARRCMKILELMEQEVTNSRNEIPAVSNEVIPGGETGITTSVEDLRPNDNFFSTPSLDNIWLEQGYSSMIPSLSDVDWLSFAPFLHSIDSGTV